jgi:MFS transporter, OFA family, oxalate/formate antiporter
MSSDTASPLSAPTYRWIQLAVGVVCMILIANLQYGWTLFVKPMAQTRHWDVASIQVAFSIFIALETWLTPIEGWIADTLGATRGPRLVVAAGGVLVAAGWITNSLAHSLPMLYLGAALSGTGAGAVYAVCIGNAVKWFADRRGLAVGITAGGFGAGAALTVIPIRMTMAAHGYAATFFWFGLIQGGIIFVVAWLLRAPLPGDACGAVASPRVAQTAHSFAPAEVIVSRTFWLLYVMFVLVSASGLMVAAQISLVADSFGIGDSVLFLGASTVTVALIVDSVMNGTARPFFGWVSDHIGREYTMALAFGLGGISYWLLGLLGTTPWAFVVFAGLIFFTWGEIFSLFPATCTDIFGSQYATVNAALLYTAKGTSAFLVPAANLLMEATGSWHAVFAVTAVANFIVVALALFALRPLRARQQAAIDAAMGRLRPAE